MTSESQTTTKSITWDAHFNLLMVDFPFDWTIVGTVKAIKGARFDGFDKVWTVPLASGESLLAQLPDFTVSQEARDAIATFKPSPYRGSISQEGKRIVIRFEYDAALVERVKTVPNAKFDGDNRYWTIPLSSVGEAIAALPDFSVGEDLVTKYEALMADHLKHQERERQIASSLEFKDEPLPSGRVLYAHQKTGVKFLLKRRRAILADDMGLGKSIQALVAAKAFNVPVLVICPASLKLNWQREAEMVGLTIEVYSWGKLPEPPRHEYVIILDEAHYAQNLKAKRTHDALELTVSPFCRGCFALTGTPLKNGRPVNLYPLLAMVRHPLARDKTAYERRYCDARPTRFTRWDVSGASHLDELHDRLKDVMLRRMKAECLDLPDKTRVTRLAELSAKARKTYDERFAALQKEYHLKLKAAIEAAGGYVPAEQVDELVSDAEAIVLMNHLRHAGSHAKAETAIELAEEIIEQGGQVVIFVAFKEPGKVIADSLGVRVFSGDLDGPTRQDLVDRFQKGIDKAFVGTIQAGGVGVTLTAAQTVIMVDRMWSPADVTQAEDRLHRIGQKNAVTSIWIQYDSIDIEIDDILEDKQDRIEQVLAGKRKTLRGGMSVGQMAQTLLPLILGD